MTVFSTSLRTQRCILTSNEHEWAILVHLVVVPLLLDGVISKSRILDWSLPFSNQFFYLRIGWTFCDCLLKQTRCLANMPSANPWRFSKNREETQSYQRNTHWSQKIIFVQKFQKLSTSWIQLWIFTLKLSKLDFQHCLLLIQRKRSRFLSETSSCGFSNFKHIWKEFLGTHYIATFMTP